MDLDKLLKRQDALVAEMEKVVAASGAASAALARPIEIQQARVKRIKERVAALEEAKSEYARQVDLEINELKAELKGLDARLKADRERLAPALAKTPTTGAAAKPRAKAKPTPKP